MLDLLRGSPIPVIQPKPFKIPPWKNHPIELNFHHPYESKSKLTPKEACQLAEDNILSIETCNDHIYYTDGSVSDSKDSFTFYIQGFSKSKQLNNKATIFQAELYAIYMAFKHSNYQGNDRVVIHTDSLSALQGLSKRRPSDNISLVNDILIIAKKKTIKPLLNWVSSHTSIKGNER